MRALVSSQFQKTNFMNFFYIKQFCFLVVSLCFATGSYAQKNKSGNWVLNCEADKPCFISQQIEFKNNGHSTVVGGASVFYASKHLVLRLRFSPNAKKSQGVGIKIDKNQALHLPITACDNKVCEANIAIDDQLLTELRSGEFLSIAYFDKSAKQKTLPVFLNNFNEIFESLNKN